MMKVINLIEDKFEQDCIKLANLVLSSYEPDLIIGILTGGGYLGRIMINSFQKDKPVQYTEIKIERVSTSYKRQFNIRQLFKFIPTSILNILRIIEVLCLEVKSKIITPKRSGSITFSPEIEKFLLTEPRDILIIDDCIDTGATFAFVKQYIEQKFGIHHNIKFAVITQAHKKPIIDVDYKLYHRVLVRFPWSFDNN